MTTSWRIATLGEILKRVKQGVSIEDELTYKQVTVRLWNKGVVLRGEQLGSEIKTKRQFMVRTGQLILSRIDVRNGAIGLCPPELEGAIISNDFWAYDFDETAIIPAFLAHYVSLSAFLDAANRISSGTTKRIRAVEELFLNIEIPLPPLDEQRRIVSCIEALAARVNHALELRRQAMEEIEVFWKSNLNQVFQKTSDLPLYTLENVCDAIIDNLHSTPKYDGNDYPCIRSQDIGWGVFCKIKTDHPG
jgi:type I restriction enzyme S subunit